MVHRFCPNRKKEVDRFVTSLPTTHWSNGPDNLCQQDKQRIIASTHRVGPSLKTTVDMRPAGAGAKAEAPVTARATKATVNFILMYLMSFRCVDVKIMGTK